MKKYPEIKLYGLNFQSRAERVMWTLSELEIPYQLIRLNVQNGELKSEEFKQLNPDQKVPVLVYGDTVMTESISIMEFLNAVSESKHLIPKDPLEEQRYKQLMYYALTEIEPYLWIGHQITNLPKIYSWPEGTREQALKLAEHCIPKIESILEKSEYIMGNNFTLADIYYFTLISFMRMQKLEIPKVFRKYQDRLRLREGFQKTPFLKTRPVRNKDI